MKVPLSDVSLLLDGFITNSRIRKGGKDIQTRFEAKRVASHKESAVGTYCN